MEIRRPDCIICHAFDIAIGVIYGGQTAFAIVGVVSGMPQGIIASNQIAIPIIMKIGDVV